MAKVFYKKLGESMKNARSDGGLTQQDVADRLNLSRSTITCWETGARAINIDDLIKYCDAINANVNDVLTPVRKFTYKK